jgi:hypothetical protein
MHRSSLEQWNRLIYKILPRKIKQSRVLKRMNMNMFMTLTKVRVRPRLKAKMTRL